MPLASHDADASDNSLKWLHKSYYIFSLIMLN